VHVVAEILDQSLHDVHDKPAGRVDGIVLELRSGRPPRVSYIEVSPITLLSRFSRRLASWYARFDARLGDGRGVPFRIPWSRLTLDGPTLRLDFDAETTPIFALERRLRRFVAKIPGA
jgi:hypothetical protein